MSERNDRFVLDRFVLRETKGRGFVSSVVPFCRRVALSLCRLRFFCASAPRGGAVGCLGKLSKEGEHSFNETATTTSRRERLPRKAPFLFSLFFLKLFVNNRVSLGT